MSKFTSYRVGMNLCMAYFGAAALNIYLAFGSTKVVRGKVQ